MNLYIIRHAEAVPLGNNGVNADAERPLTDKGHEQSKRLAATLEQHAVQLDLILTSPYLRARQTAQGILDHWNGTAPTLGITEELTPELKAGKLARVLRKSKKENVALVGHMPDLGIFTGWLLGSKKLLIDFDKSGVAYLKCDDEPDKGSAVLQWLITPDWFSSSVTARR